MSKKPKRLNRDRKYLNLHSSQISKSDSVNTLSNHLLDQGIFRIFSYPFNLFDYINLLSPLIITIIIVTIYGTCKIIAKDYDYVLQSIIELSTRYKFKGLVEYIKENYNKIIHIDKRILKQYYITEKEIQKFEQLNKEMSENNVRYY